MSKDLYTEIINNEQMTNTFDRDSLISDYAELVVDDMDLKTLVQLAYDMICENMERMTDNEIVEDVNNCYPELLEQYSIDPDMYLWSLTLSWTPILTRWITITITLITLRGKI